MAEDPSITLDRLLKLRRVTRALADQLEAELRVYLDTLAPLLRPKRLLGDFIAGESTETHPDAAKAFGELQSLWPTVAERPFRLRPVLQKPLPAVRVRLELLPFEEAWASSDGARRLRVVSPLIWVLGFPGGCKPGALRRMLAGEEPRNEAEIQGFVLHAFILHLLLERNPGIVRLFAALGFPLETRRLPEFGALPIPVVRSVMPCTRPSASVMLDAAELAGLATFEEVIDVAGARAIQDPLRRRLEELLAEHVGEA